MDLLESIVSEGESEGSGSEKTFGQVFTEMAAVLDQLGYPNYDGHTHYIFAQTEEEFRKYARQLKTFTKSADSDFFNITRSFGRGFAIQVAIARHRICELVTVGFKEVPEVVIPEQVIPAHRKPITEWRCKGSILKAPEGGA